MPWVAFPSYLWITGRGGMSAPAQLNDDSTCDTNMIGTGPFKLVDFNPTTGDVKVEKNENYWRKGFPYLDGIQWKIQEDGDQRVNGLQGGQFDVIHDDAGKNLDTIEGFGGGFTVDEEPDGLRESGQTLLNVTRPPLDDLRIRRAIAMGLDRDDTWARVERLRGRTPAAAYAERTHAGTGAQQRDRYGALADAGVDTVFVGLADLEGPEDLHRLAPVLA